MKSFTRRRFLRRACGAAVAGAMLPGCGREPRDETPARDAARAAARDAARGAAQDADRPAAEDAQDAASGSVAIPVIDTHQHLWDLRRFDLAWVKSSPILHRSFLPGDYAAEADGLDVAQAIYMEVAVAPEDIVAEAEFAVDLCERRGLTRAAVIGGRPAEEGFEAHARRFREHPCVKGVRQVLFHDPGLCVSEPFVRSMRLLGRLGLSFDICLPPGDLRHAATLAERCPETRFVLDHCGNADPKAFAPPREGEAPSHDPDAWRRDLAEVAGRENVVCKISGIVARARPDLWSAEDLRPIIRHCRETFGPRRLIFGSDWPVCTPVATLREWLGALKEVIGDWPIEERRRLLHDNAARLFGLG